MTKRLNYNGWIGHQVRNDATENFVELSDAQELIMAQTPPSTYISSDFKTILPSAPSGENTKEYLKAADEYKKGRDEHPDVISQKDRMENPVDPSSISDAETLDEQKIRLEKERPEKENSEQVNGK